MKPAASSPIRLESRSGLCVEVNANGSLRRLQHRDILLNLFPGNEMEGGPANLYLRRVGDTTYAAPLLGPCSPSRSACDGTRLRLAGQWQDLRYAVTLTLAESAAAWYWHVLLENTGTETATVDLIYVQDLGLAQYAAVRLNEYFVSQYLDHTPLAHLERGLVLASHQNQAAAGRNPWCVIGSLSRGTGFATDALQVHGLTTRAGRVPAGVIEGLPNLRLQHEHAMAAVQDAPVRLEPGARSERGFFGWFEEHHPAATSDADLAFVDRALTLPEAAPPDARPSSTMAQRDCASLFSSAPLFEALELSDAEIDHLFGAEHRHPERDAQGRFLSFFTGSRTHVVLKAKELQVLRPHAHMLRSGSTFTPDESALTSTAWMAGVFHSMLTQGHVSINRLLSTTHSYLGLFRSHGQRLFAQIGAKWHLLDVPSAFEIRPDGCRWIYRHAEGTLEVRAGAHTERHELSFDVNVLAGPPMRFLLANHIALNGDDGSESKPVRFERQSAGVFVRAIPDSEVGRRFPDGGFFVRAQAGTVVEQLGGDELLFADGVSRREPFLCFVTAPARSVGFRIEGRLVPEEARIPNASLSADAYWRMMTAGLHLTPPASSPLTKETEQLVEILPWFAHNALIHYLAPRGLEQYSGGGWGSRDVTQGPVELLLAIGRAEPLRDVFLRVFRNQNAGGDWPQWFMFFERERTIRAGDSHGDIVFWPLLALGQYLLASEDVTLLQETVPFFHPDGETQAERATVWEHVERALQVIDTRVIAGTRLAAYGHGDWNDSLQPVDPSFRERLCSAWTVTLHYQMLITLGRGLRRIGREHQALPLERSAEEVQADFQRYLVVEGTVAGYAHFAQADAVTYLLHPADRTTGLSYSLLPMIHGILSELFTPAQACHHLSLIEQHLLGPDGARLFDKPLAYHGGPQRFFQRAESSSFFGREIGLMYTHAHLRYAEALWAYGDADGFLRTLCQVVPIGLDARVPPATRRQANCYYSSSDAAFADRYQAYVEYDRALAGEIPLDGGWRIYSSGAGIATALVFRCFLGLRLEPSRLVVDPAIPKSLDGLRAELELGGVRCEITYRIATRGCGVVALEVNGEDLPFARRHNPYRQGGAVVSLTALQEKTQDGTVRLNVRLA